MPVLGLDSNKVSLAPPAGRVKGRELDINRQTSGDLNSLGNIKTRSIDGDSDDIGAALAQKARKQPERLRDRLLSTDTNESLASVSSNYFKYLSTKVALLIDTKQQGQEKAIGPLQAMAEEGINACGTNDPRDGVGVRLKKIQGKQEIAANNDPVARNFIKEGLKTPSTPGAIIDPSVDDGLDPDMRRAADAMASGVAAEDEEDDRINSSRQPKLDITVKSPKKSSGQAVAANARAVAAGQGKTVVSSIFNRLFYLLI